MNNKYGSFNHNGDMDLEAGGMGSFVEALGPAALHFRGGIQVNQLPTPIQITVQRLFGEDDQENGMLFGGIDYGDCAGPQICTSLGVALEIAGDLEAAGDRAGENKLFMGPARSVDEFGYGHSDPMLLSVVVRGGDGLVKLNLDGKRVEAGEGYFVTWGEAKSLAKLLREDVALKA